MRVSNVVLLLVCIKVFLGFPLSSAIRAKGGMWGSYRGTTNDPSADSVLPTASGLHRRGSKVGESNHPAAKLASAPLRHTMSRLWLPTCLPGETPPPEHNRNAVPASHMIRKRALQEWGRTAFVISRTSISRTVVNEA
jgi:hypothetical protein